ncbi:MAG: lipase family protein, partial [Pseudomonas sp.]
SSIIWEPGCDTITQHAACTVALEQIDGLPHRSGLLSQVFHAGNHSMVGGYIPACWATLMRWEEAFTSKGPLLTRREVRTLDDGLQRIDQQIRRKRQDLEARPDKYVQKQEPVIDALSIELSKIMMTRARLKSLSMQWVNLPDVYGHYAQQPDVLDNSLTRWQNHPENQVAEQMASAPAEVMSNEEEIASIIGRPIDERSTVDILSLF